MKKSISLILAVIMAFVLFGCSAKEEAPTTTTTETTTQPPAVVNPLTGEEGYNKNAVDVRPVAIVVEKKIFLNAIFLETYACWTFFTPEIKIIILNTLIYKTKLSFS